MPIRHEKHITRAMLKAEPQTLFVFGDNMTRRGLGGQAREMCGEPNAVGIPTKWTPRMSEDAFFKNTDLGRYITETDADWVRLEKHLVSGGTVVLPEDGIGTGLADLERRAPRIWSRLQADLAVLHEKAKLAAQDPALSRDGRGE